PVPGCGCRSPSATSTCGSVSCPHLPNYATKGCLNHLRNFAVALLDPGSGGRVCLLRCGRCCIQFAVALLDPSRADMALHCDADMVRAIVGARQVKFLSGLAGSQSQDALAEARCVGFASR